MIKVFFIFLLSSVLLIGCSNKQHTRTFVPSSTIPLSTSSDMGIVHSTPSPYIHNNICKLYNYNPNWRIFARKSVAKWGTPEYILIAFVHQESRFVQDARARFRGASTSSAFGFPQALNKTWKEYQQSTGNLHAKRTSIHYSLDFIGWYNHKSHRRNNISKNDTRNLYLAYHEGNGGFSRQTYLRKPWLLKVADKVQANAQKYKRQLRYCYLNPASDRAYRVQDIDL